MDVRTGSTSRRQLHRRGRDRRRGGAGRGPIVLQRATARVVTVIDALRAAVARAVRGDRPLLVALAGVLVVSVLVLSQPVQTYLDGRDRVETLTEKADALDEANAELEQRVEDLEDPGNVELLARETQGFIRPGEVPYAVIPPEVDRPRITAPREQPSPEPRVWYVRAWELVTGRG